GAGAAAAHAAGGRRGVRTDRGLEAGREHDRSEGVRSRRRRAARLRAAGEEELRSAMRRGTFASELIDLGELAEDSPVEAGEVELPLLMLFAAMKSVRDRRKRNVPEEYIRSLFEPTG